MVTIKEIKEELKKRKIKGISGKKKAELSKMLQDSELSGGGISRQVQAQIDDIDNTIRSMENQMERTADQELADNLARTISQLRFRRNRLLTNTQTSPEKEKELDLEARQIVKKIEKEERRKDNERRFNESMKPKPLSKEQELERQRMLQDVTDYMLRQKRKLVNWRGDLNLRTTRLPNDLKDAIDSYLFSQKALEDDFNRRKYQKYPALKEGMDERKYPKYPALKQENAERGSLQERIEMLSAQMRQLEIIIMTSADSRQRQDAQRSWSSLRDEVNRIKNS